MLSCKQRVAGAMPVTSTIFKSGVSAGPLEGLISLSAPVQFRPPQPIQEACAGVREPDRIVNSMLNKLSGCESHRAYQFGGL